MPEVAEQTTTQKLEEILKDPSPEPKTDSEETTKDDTTAEEVKGEAEETEAESTETEETKEITFTSEQEAVIEKQYQSRRDKEFNPYREKRESDTALIRKLQDEARELKSGKEVSRLDKLAKMIADGDKEEDLPEDKIEARQSAIKEIQGIAKQYAGVEEAAEMVSQMIDKLPSKIVQGFGLDDSNPAIRAKNHAEFVNETVTVFTHNQNFLMAMEKFLPKGDEVRQKIEVIVDGLAEFEGNDKAKELYLADQMKGLKVTPRKKPVTPSDGLGGVNNSDLPVNKKIERALIKMDRA